MAKIDDAYERLKAAERCKEARDYAGAIREAQLCIELSLKALMDGLSVDYTEERGGRKWIPHDVSGKVPDVFEQLKPYFEEYEVEFARGDLARAAVLSNLLWAIRNYSEHGIRGLGVGASEIFEGYPSDFGKDLAEVLVKRVSSVYYRVRDLVHKAGAGDVR